MNREPSAAGIRARRRGEFLEGIADRIREGYVVALDRLKVTRRSGCRRWRASAPAPRLGGWWSEVVRLSAGTRSRTVGDRGRFHLPMRATGDCDIQ